MKSYFRGVLVLLGVLGILSGPIAVRAEDAALPEAAKDVQTAEPRLVFAEGSQLWLVGDSTLHGFKITAEKLLVESKLEFKGNAEKVDDSSGLLAGTEEAPRITQLKVSVPIENMTSRIMGLAGQMRKALQVEVQDSIIFEMKDYTIKKDTGTPAEAKDDEAKDDEAEEDEADGEAEAKAEKYIIVAQGLLSMAGSTNSVDLTMSAEMADDVLHVVGSKEVLMSSYGIKVPVLFFGKIKTDDKIAVNWDLNVSVTTEEEKAEEE